MNRHILSGQSGFTLVELMITLVIVGILASIGIPSFVETIRQNRMTTQANEALSLLLYARGEAIKTRGVVTVTFSPSVDTGWTAIANVAGGQNIRTLDHATANVSIDGETIITFNELGRAPQSGCITLTHSGVALTRSVRTAPTGRSNVGPCT